jgi:hypothetical protein
MSQLPIDGSCEAEYQDGYIHSETQHNDVSPYTGVNNILNDILEKRPESEHGKLVRFSTFYQNNRYDVDWDGLPDNARPVRWKRMEADSVGGVITEVRLMQVGFGYQYTDENGKNIQEVQEL